MVNKIKMQVTPELSERVQEIIFTNGGYWGKGCTKVLYIDKPYLFIDKFNEIGYSAKKEFFEEDGFEEVSPYDFIASQGEQKWLPKYDEEALFSDNAEKWVKRKFKCYIPEYNNPFVTSDNIEWKYCKPLPKQISFVQFLKDNNAYEKYMHNVKIENQRWENINNYIQLDDLKKKPQNTWLFGAFSWSRQNEGTTFWDRLSDKWELLYNENNNIVWE